MYSEPCASIKYTLCSNIIVLLLHFIFKNKVKWLFIFCSNECHDTLCTACIVCSETDANNAVKIHLQLCLCSVKWQFSLWYGWILRVKYIFTVSSIFPRRTLSTGFNLYCILKHFCCHFFKNTFGSLWQWNWLYILNVVLWYRQTGIFTSDMPLWQWYSCICTWYTSTWVL